MAGIGFPFGTEAVLAGKEDHSTYRLIIYILIVRGLRNYTLPKASGENMVIEFVRSLGLFFFLATRPSYIPIMIIFLWNFFFLMVRYNFILLRSGCISVNQWSSREEVKCCASSFLCVLCSFRSG